MAEGAADRMQADVAVAVTGSAGPDPQEREIGTMIIGVHTPDGSGTRVLRLPGDRERIRTYATTAALHLLRLAIVGEWWDR
jgi:nicotinamide-nucleotide amidase